VLLIAVDKPDKQYLISLPSSLTLFAIISHARLAGPESQVVVVGNRHDRGRVSRGARSASDDRRNLSYGVWPTFPAARAGMTALSRGKKREKKNNENQKKGKEKKTKKRGETNTKEGKT
jgi:hypothetical protein